MPRPVKALRPKDRARLADQAAIAGSTHFVVNWFVGRDPRVALIRTRECWDRADFRAEDYGSRELALAAARFAVFERGRDEHGRTGLLYAISPSGISIHVE